MEDSGSDDSSKEDEEVKGEEGGPPTLMLFWGVFHSLKMNQDLVHG